MTYEVRDLSSRSILVWESVLLGSILAGVILLALFFPGALRGPRTTGRNHLEKFPSPRLQTDPAADWQQYRHRQKQLLNGWSWVDSSKQRLRMPVAYAKRLFLEGQKRNGDLDE